MKKVTAAIIAALLCVTLLAGCGKILGNYKTITVSSVNIGVTEDDENYESLLKNEVEAAIYEGCNFSNYSQKDYRTMYNELYQLEANQLSNYADEYEVSADVLATLYGYESSDDYSAAMATSQLNHSIMYEELAKDLNMVPSDEKIDEAIGQYAEDSGYMYSANAMKKLMGDTWTYVYVYNRMMRDEILDALMDRVVIE